MKNAESNPRDVPRGSSGHFQEHRSSSNQLVKMRRRIAPMMEWGDTTIGMKMGTML